MSITASQLKEIRQEFARLKPATVTLDGNRAMTVKQATFTLAPTLERMKKRGFDTQEIVEKLHEKGIEVKAQTLTKYLTDGGMLTRDFDQLFSSVVPVLRSVQEAVVIPLAMIVLTVFFVAGIASAVAEMGRAESGIDTVQLMMVFIAYALVGSLIVNSWELMVLCYDLVTQVISGIGGTVNTEVYTGLPDDVNNIGVLLSLLVTSGVVWVIAGAVALLTQVIIITRAIQIYVYTCLAPASIAFLVSPKSRPMATGFLKRYLALLFAGVIMALLFAMMSAILAGFGDIAVTASDYEGMIYWSGRLLFSCVSLLAYGYAMWSAGGWAREFVGV